jgi:sarcosine oxidase gamma subunit
MFGSIREHTALQDFTWMDRRVLMEVTQSADFDPVLQALSACPHLQLVNIMTQFASADAIRNLLQLPADPFLSLALAPDQWLVMADEIRLRRCLIKKLHLMLRRSSIYEATEAVKAVASAI